MLFLYISLIDRPEEKDKFEKLYLNYSNLMYHEHGVTTSMLVYYPAPKNLEKRTYIDG